MVFKKLFFGGKRTEETAEDIKGIVDYLKARTNYLHGLSVDDIIDFLDKVGESWRKDDHFKKNAVLKSLATFISKSNLETVLDTSLRGDRRVLDSFLKLNKTNTLFHAQPRGLAAHWIAGNTPTLGMYSILQALLTKNVSLVKASTRAYQELIFLLESLSKINTEKINGMDILETVSVILVDHSEKEIHEKISLSADIRIAWGGRDSIDTIIGLKKKFWAEDIIYGPKYSYAIIDKESLSKNHDNLAQRLSMDVSIFDQYACSSPHTVFIEIGGKITPLDFAGELAKKLDSTNRLLIAKQSTDQNEAMKIHKIRSEYEMRGHVFSSKNTDWTVVYSEEEGLADPCFSRVIFVRPINDINDIVKYSDRHKQTLGVAIDSKRKLSFIDRATIAGVDRCPNLGNMSNFESPWDGMFGIERMVRWITTAES